MEYVVVGTTSMGARVMLYEPNEAILPAIVDNSPPSPHFFFFCYLVLQEQEHQEEEEDSERTQCSAAEHCPGTAEQLQSASSEVKGWSSSPTHVPRHLQLKPSD